MFIDFLASQKHHVYISHSHEADTLPTVDMHSFVAAEKKSLSVFVDQRSIRPGDKWPFELPPPSKTYKAFVTVLTNYKCYMRSVCCNGQLYEAEALGKCLFSVVCEGGWRDVPGGAPWLLFDTVDYSTINNFLLH